MPTGRPKVRLKLDDVEREQLNSFARSRTLPSALVGRAKLVLWSAAGHSDTEIADRLHCTKATVGKWRQRFIEHRVAGPYDEVRPGRPRSIEDEKIAALLKRTVCPSARRTGPSAVRRAPAAFPNPACIGCFKPSLCSRIAPALSSSPPIPFSSRRCAMWSACI